MDVAREIAAKNGKKLIIEDMKFDALIPALNSGKSYEISLFQGRYIQSLLASNIRRRRVGTTLLRR